MYNAVSSPTVTNNTITGNGTGIYLAFSSLVITNNVVSNNIGGIWCYNASPTITNNVITGNVDWGIYCRESSSPTISYNDVWSNGVNYYDLDTGAFDLTGIDGNISADPIFVDPPAGDYRLQGGSPCIDAGTNGAPALPGIDFDGNLRRVHLEDESNPYNTYRIRGLPPGPIASPGRDALRAVVEPADSDYLFFVARGDGTHEFSVTYADHDRAVDRYQRRRRR